MKKAIQTGRDVMRYVHYKKLADMFLAKTRSVGFAYSTDHICLTLPVADYLRLFPEAQPELRTFTCDGKLFARMDYPVQQIAELKPDFFLRVQANTAAFEVNNDKVQITERKS